MGSLLKLKLIASVSEEMGVDFEQVNRIFREFMPKIETMSDTALEKEIAHLGNKLAAPLSTIQIAGDFHGQVGKFRNMLFRRFGLICLKIEEKLNSLSKTQKAKMEYIIRTGNLPKDYSIYFSKQEIMNNLMKLLRARAGSLNQTDYVRENSPEHLRQNIMNLFDDHLSELEHQRLFNDEKTFGDYVKAIAEIIRTLLFGEHGKIMVLGDIIDRGAEPDLLVKELQKYEKFINYVWGNHDVLWMGAAAGHPSLVAEALRISFRYDQTDFIEKRMGFDFTKLRKFVEENYGTERPAAHVKAKKDINALIEKALFIIQSKLEHEVIMRNPAYKMEGRLYLADLAEAKRLGKETINVSGQEYHLQDKYFPTIDVNDPTQLTGAEQEVIDDLVRQFRTNEKLKEMMRFLYEKGKMYDVYNKILLIHANVPSNEKGELEKLEAFEGRKGKALYDYLNTKIKATGQLYLGGEKISAADLDYFFYLWSGKGSPLFDKDKMATWERYFTLKAEEKGLWKETSLFWAKNMEKEEFRKMLMREFSTTEEQIETIAQGHTPKDPSDMKNVVKGEGEWLVADVGWIDNYPGHTIIETSKKRYLVTINMTKDQMKEFDKIVDAETEIDIKFTVLREWAKQRTFADISKSNKTKVVYDLMRKEKEARNNRAA